MPKTKKLVLSAMFLAIGFVLPFITGQIPLIGKRILPMHIPVILCGMICGPFYGVIVGAILPILRSLIFGAPVFFPNAVAMTVELIAYGFFAGFIFNRFKNKNLLSIYVSLISAMIIGRICWGIAETLLLSLSGEVFTFALFIGGAFIDALPGIVIQIVLIPLIMLILIKLKKPYFIKEKGGKNEV